MIKHKKDEAPFGLKIAKGPTKKLRISSGEFKNTHLQVPESARPAMEKVKLAVFSLINDYIEDRKCLDLFAGAGSLGFEALSRGALSCDFIDNDYFAIKCLRENIAKINQTFKIELTAQAIKDDSLKYVANTDKSYNLVFIDPPYDQHNHKHLFKLMHEIVEKEGIIIYLSNKTDLNIAEINPNLQILDTRKYGITKVEIIQVKSKDLVLL